MPSRRSACTRKSSRTRYAGVDYSFYQPPKKKQAPPRCPHGTPIGTSVYLPLCCQKATPEDIAAITLPLGEVPEFPDLPLPDPYDMDIGESQIVLTYDPFAHGSDEPDLPAG